MKLHLKPKFVFICDGNDNGNHDNGLNMSEAIVTEAIFNGSYFKSLVYLILGLHYRCFPENFADFFRTSIRRNTCSWLVLSCITNMFVLEDVIGFSSLLLRTLRYRTQTCRLVSVCIKLL